MKAMVLVACVFVWKVKGIRYDNATLPPAALQLEEFRREHPRTIGLLTTSSGEPVEIRDTILINSDQFRSQFHLDLLTTFDGVRIPARVVHAKGTGAFGYFIVTNDVSQYTSADVFNGIGKKTPVVARLSTGMQRQGGTDVSAEFKGLSIKFYSNEGNLDLLCLQTPVFVFRNPLNFHPLVNAFQKNSKTNLVDETSVWDLITLRPDLLHSYLWTQSDYGDPDGYRKMDVFPIHTYELNNKHGDRYYARFNFRTEQGLANLTIAEAARIQGMDLDYYTRDLYNAIARKDYPSWRLEIDVMSLKEIQEVGYNPFDVTRLWKNGTYITVQIGRLILNRNPDNIFADIESSAFNPGNLVPGIPGPVDNMYRARRLFYRDAQNYRLGRNHNKIHVNLPKYAKTYVRDGVPPTRDNMRDVPSYYPNSFSGPMPYVDETRPKERLLVLDKTAIDLAPANDFYNNVLVNEGQRQRLVDRLVASLVSVIPAIQERVFKFMYLIDKDLGMRIELGVRAASIAAMAQPSS